MNILAPNKDHIVVDVDELLVLISPKWIYTLIEEDYDYFNKYFHLPDKDTFVYNSDFEFRVMQRKNFYIDQWLIRNENRELYSPEEIITMRKKFMEAYDRPDFYDNLNGTPIAEALSAAARQPDVKTVSIITRCTDNNRESKEKLIRRIFGNNHKVDLYFLDLNEKKSDVIKGLGNRVGAIFEDERENILDIADNCPNLNEVTFYVPAYGYNLPTTEMIDKFNKDKRFEVEYYQP